MNKPRKDHYAFDLNKVSSETPKKSDAPARNETPTTFSAKKMTLQAWFDPRDVADPRDSLVNRQALGWWRLKRLKGAISKKVYYHSTDLSLADGSMVRVSATCDLTYAAPLTTVGVSSGGNVVFIASVSGAGNFAARIATGKGGFLSLQVLFFRDARKNEKA